MTNDLIQLTDRGLYCLPGDFFIDPWKPVPRAVITHAHSDHARPGSAHYLTAEPGRRVLQARMGEAAVIDTLPYGTAIDHNNVRVSFHPAGHVLGSAQVRLEHRGEVWVITGDYKLDPDPTCAPFEAVRCHGILTESTFGLPIYRWENPAAVAGQISEWWRSNRDAGKASVLYGYALGKAQRMIAGLDPDIGPIWLHGAVERMSREYRASGVPLPTTQPVSAAPAGTKWSGAMIVATPSAHNTPWTKKFAPSSSAMASGWMRVRGNRRRKAVDRGFVLSDHADWPGLLTAIEASGAERVWVTHGFVDPLVRRLKELGLDAAGLRTAFEGETDDAEAQT